ncbi:MAG: putative oxidoreductase [Friedmanniella sp.]|nr:putative oxidoreductase [Friedmanniella sp.]
MELTEVLRRRRMVRSYDPDRPVPAEDLEAVLAAALRTPSAGFTQAVSLLVLTAEVDRDAFWDDCAEGESRWLRGMRTAPVLVLLWTSAAAYADRYAEPDKGWVDRDLGRWSAPYWYVDAGMSALAALLSVVDRGLGGCFFGVPVDRVAAVRRRFGVPPDQLCVGVVSLGYPAPDVTPSGSPTRRPRRAADDLVHRSHWGRPG